VGVGPIGGLRVTWLVHASADDPHLGGLLGSEWSPLCVKPSPFQTPNTLSEELDGPTVSVFGIQSRKLSNIGRSSDGWPKIYYLKLLCASEDTLSRWSCLHLQSLAPTNPHWTRVMFYGPLSLYVIHKEGLCPSNGDTNRLIMITLTHGLTVPGGSV
jgi:hypothetical protein